MWAASRSWKREGNKSSLEFPEETRLYPHLDFSLVRFILDLQNYMIKNVSSIEYRPTCGC